MLLVGQELASHFPAGQVILLDGPMGAGKTTLAKGIVEGLGAGVADDVSSPTFPIVHEYRARTLVYHLDLYRLDTVQQVLGIGIDDFLEDVQAGVATMLVEWGERFPELWPRSYWRVAIRVVGDGRQVSLERNVAGLAYQGDAADER